MEDIFVQLMDKYDSFTEECEKLKAENCLARAEALLKEVREAGQTIADPEQRGILSALARELGEILFGVTGKYPSVRLAYPVEHRDVRDKLPSDTAVWQERLSARFQRARPYLLISALALAIALPLAFAVVRSIREVTAPRVAITTPSSGSGTLCLPGWGCYLGAEGTSQNVASNSDLGIYMFVKAQRPANAPWFRHPDKARLEDASGTWQANAQLGSNQYPPQTGDVFQLIALVLADESVVGGFEFPDYRGLPYLRRLPLAHSVIMTTALSVKPILPEVAPQLDQQGGQEFLFGSVNGSWELEEAAADLKQENPYFLSLSFKVLSEYPYGGWAVAFGQKPFDSKSFQELVLRVRVKEGKERFEVNLEDMQEMKSTVVVTATKDMANAWREIAIPLSDFEKERIQRDALKAITIGFNDSLGSATIDVSLLEFRR